jgi:hypothetical protein
MFYDTVDCTCRDMIFFLYNVSTLNSVCKLRTTIQFKVVLERFWAAKIWGVVLYTISVVRLVINTAGWFS